MIRQSNRVKRSRPEVTGNIGFNNSAAVASTEPDDFVKEIESVDIYPSIAEIIQSPARVSCPVYRIPRSIVHQIV